MAPALRFLRRLAKEVAEFRVRYHKIKGTVAGEQKENPGNGLLPIGDPAMLSCPGQNRKNNGLVLTKDDTQWKSTMNRERM